MRRGRGLAALAARFGHADSERVALGVFVLYLLAAYVAILFHYGRDEWFIRGDWAFFQEEMLPNVFQPVEQHWSTVPVLIHRCYFRLFGLNYFPFLATVSGLHIAIVCLVRTVQRRAGVGAWTATFVAAPLALFGPGYMAIVFSLQISQDLSIAFGLLHLLLADRDGRLGRRDWLGLLAGTIGLMSSGVAVFMVTAVGLVALARRGARAAAFHTVPLGVLYLVWFLLTRPAALSGRDLFRVAGYDPREHVLFVVRGILGTIWALGHFAPSALALGLVLIVGLVVSRPGSTPTAPSRSYAPLALLAITPLYLGVIGYQRSSSGPEYATYSHHLYTVACFILPAMGVAVDALARRWPLLGRLLTGLLLLPIPFNLKAFDQSSNRNVFLATSFLQESRQRLFAVAHSPYASRALHVKRSNLATDRWYASLTVGWALDQAKLGRIPKPERVDPKLDDWLQLFYGVTFAGTRAPSPTCLEHEHPIDIRPRQGERVDTGTPVAVSNVRRRESLTDPLVFGSAAAPAEGQSFLVELADMVLRLSPVDGLKSYSYCSVTQPAEVANKANQ